MRAENLFLVIVSLFLCTGFGSCSSTLTEVCELRIPRFSKSLESALASVDQYRTDALAQAEANRSLASVDGSPAPVRPLRYFLPEKVQTQWKDWAEDKLSEVQKLTDLAEGHVTDRVLLGELHKVANELVFFWGYADHSDVMKMYDTLASIRKRQANIQELACRKG